MNEPDHSGEAAVWMLVMIVSVVYAVGSLLAPLVLVSWLQQFPGYPIELLNIVLMASLPNVVFGVIGVWFGHHMYRKTSNKTIF